MYSKLKDYFGATTISLFITMVLVFLLMYALNGGRFVSSYNIGSMAYQMPIIGLLSVGMMYAMLTGGINLAIVSNANLNGMIIWIVLAWLTGDNMKEASVFQVALAILAGLIVSIAIGVLHGVLVAALRIPALLVTLGTMTLIVGINVAVTRGYTISGFPDSLTSIGNGRIAGVVPIPIIIFILGCIATAIILNRTRFGFSLYMMGANETAAKYSGVNILKVTIFQYIASSVFASLTSLVMIGQLNSIKANYVESYVLVAVLACFLGGIDPNGGFGKLSGVIIATVILQLIASGLNLMRMDPFMITAMWGGIIIILIFGRALWAATKRKLTPKVRPADGD